MSEKKQIADSANKKEQNQQVNSDQSYSESESDKDDSQKQQQQKLKQQEVGQNISINNNSKVVQAGQKNQQGTVNKLSKRQQRKLEKKQKWDLVKRQKRKQQRQKQKLKKKQKRQQLQKQKIQQTEQKDQNYKNPHEQKIQPIQNPKKRKQQYKQKMLDSQKVAIDLQFYQSMTQKQLTSLGKQLAYCHSLNRKSAKPFNFILTSATQQRVKFLDSKYNVCNFGITILENDVLECFGAERVVYLTGDAQEVLGEFDPNDVYVIGGIVDHNRLKNITINYARQKNIRACRLPMEGLKLKASVHLAVNHVWEWMLRYYNGETWKQAITSVIPQRKLQKEQQQVVSHKQNDQQ